MINCGVFELGSRSACGPKWLTLMGDEYWVDAMEASTLHLRLGVGVSYPGKVR